MVLERVVLGSQGLPRARSDIAQDSNQKAVIEAITLYLGNPYYPHEFIQKACKEYRTSRISKLYRCVKQPPAKVWSVSYGTRCTGSIFQPETGSRAEDTL